MELGTAPGRADPGCPPGTASVRAWSGLRLSDGRVGARARGSGVVGPLTVARGNRRRGVAPERVAGGCSGSAERHGGVPQPEPGPDRWRSPATDGAVALLEPQFPPVPAQSAAATPGLAVEP